VTILMFTTKSATTGITVSTFTAPGNVVLQTGLAVTEVVAGLYTVDISTTSGIVYMVGSSAALTVSGYANLSYTQPNGYVEVLNSYDDAIKQGLLTQINTGVQGYISTPISQLAKSTGDLNVKIGVDFQIPLNVVIPVTWIKLYFTAKKDYRTDTDSQSVIQLLLTNPANGSNDGLIFFKQAVGTKANGSLSLSVDRTLLTVFLKAATTSLLTSSENGRYDIKVVTSSGTIPYLVDSASIQYDSLVTNALS